MSEPSDHSRSRSRSEDSPTATELGDRDRDHERERERGDRGPPRKRQRVRLSCLECRRRKLSCDREFPCSRCLQSGTGDRCEYETRPGLAPLNKLGLSQSALSGLDATRLSLPSSGADSSIYRRDAREADRIRRLELEVAQLKGLLSKQISLDGSTILDQSPATQKLDDGPAPDAALPPYVQLHGYDLYQDREEPRFFRGKEFKTRYFGPHSAFLAFSELSGLSPFMKETSDEWLRPLRLQHDQKDRRKRADDREKKFHEPDLALEALLPSREETDNLVSIYLDQFEQIHRIIHIPSFHRQYNKFWEGPENRNAAFTALILAIMAISSCLDENAPQKFERLVSISHANALKWIQAVDAFMAGQSQKHRRLIHFQIGCLLYLAKRVNTVKKKRFWTGAGTLTMDAISVGLHWEPSHMNDKISPFNQEMRRRLWATIQCFDIQASYDYGLPSILNALHSDVNPPRNIDDDEFDEDTKEMPPSKPTTEYTFSSYQHLTRQSLPLRVELGSVLTGPSKDLDYDQVIRYTNEINQEIDSLPSWDVSDESTCSNSGQGVPKKPLLAYTLLHIQLRQYIITLHQTYLRLRKTNSKYQYSEIIYYNAARDMVLLNDKLAQQGIRTLSFLREDNLTLAINLCSVTILQPRGSTNMIMINSQHTLQLIEKCLAMKEDRILRCGNHEPWGYSIMCAAYGLLEAHLGTKTPEAAKAASAERFVNVHYKLLAGQEPPASSQLSACPSAAAAAQGAGLPGAGVGGRRSATPFSSLPPPMEGFIRSKSVTPFPPASQGSATGGPGPIEVPGTPWWLPNSDPNAITQPMNDFNSFEMLGLNLNNLWGNVDSWDWDPSFDR